MRTQYVRVIPFALLLWGSEAVGQTTLTLEDAIQRARARAPEIVAAVARIDEARAQVLAADALRDNPVLEFDAGPRQNELRRTWDANLTLGQTFESGGQRAARVDAARAIVEQTAASSDEVARQITRDVAVAFIRGLAADERVRQLAAAESVAEQLRLASERRYGAGDISALDVNLTRVAVARARAERMRAEAERTQALQPLRVALGIAPETTLALAGSLDRQPASKEVLLRSIEQSPVLRVADAEVAVAQADLRLGEGMRHPDLGARVSLRREQDDHIVTGGVSITMPVFQKGQTIAADATARTRRLTLEREAIRRTLSLQVASSLAVYEQRRDAAEVLRSAALPAAADNEGLSTRSLDAGEISLLNALLVRQDVTAVRLAYIEALADAAVASVEVDALAGVLR